MSRSSTVIGPFISRTIYAVALFSFSLLAILIIAPDVGHLVKAGDSINITTIPVGSSPVKAAINLFTNKIYVANSMSNNVTVIDENDNTTVTVAAGLSPNDISVNQLTNKIYVSNYFGGTVTVIDGIDNSTTTVQAGLRPGRIAINPLTNKIYVTNADSHDITIINGADNATSTVFIGGELNSVEVDPVTNKVYFTVPSSNYVGVLDGRTNSLATVPVAAFSAAIAINPVTSKLYIADSNINKVVLFDSVRGSTETINVGVLPRSLAINQVTNKIYVANSGSNSVTVINGNDNSVSSIELLFNPSFVVVDPAINRIYASGNSNNRVAMIDGTDNSVTQIFTDTSTFNANVNPITNKVYVVNFQPSVTVIDPTPKTMSPFSTVITPLPGNITGNSSPSFTLTATLNLPEAPPPQNIYFQIDTTTGAWTSAENIGVTDTTLTARAATEGLRQGMHIIYFFAASNAEGPAVADGINAYPFFVVLNPTAAEVSITGRVLTPGGNPLRSAWVELVDSEGIPRVTASSSLGYYRFDQVRTGRSYIINASAKRYRFDPQVVTVNSELTDLDFIARAGAER